MLILGGPAWLGREIAGQAVLAGHDVSCLARGDSGHPALGVKLIRVDRRDPGAYATVARDRWDSVIEVSWQPGFVREALIALADRSRHWIYVSSVSVYASGTGCPNATPLTEEAPLLAPAIGASATQVIDVRDLARWLVASAQAGLGGPRNAVGPLIPFDTWVALSRRVGGHVGRVVRVAESRLSALGVQQWAGPDSLPLWVAGGDRPSFCERAAESAGLSHRPRLDLLAHTLDWERARGLFRDRRAGLTDRRERELIARLASHQ
jgi:hypothetical protein